MRLICGILRLDGCPAPEGALAAMIAAMTPPGLAPAVSRTSSGMLEMAILDFSGSLPALVKHDGWIVAADMRLDDCRADDGRIFARAVAAHGPDFPDHINGDFAVALWKPDKRALWLGRDFIGARPLAWTMREGKWFAFASLPKGLHEAGLASKTPDPIAQAARLRQSFYTGSDSGFAEISYLPAGHSLQFRLGDSQPQLHRAYRPDARKVGSWRGTRKQAAAELRLLLDQAVRRRLPQTGPVGCHLSGGLDSSAITALAAQAAPGQGCRVIALSMTTQTAIGPARLDERPLIESVLAAHPGVEHFVTHDSLRVPGQLEDPDWPGSLVGGADDTLFRQAAVAGVERVLSGVGGDEGATYNGANIYAKLLKTGQLRTLACELPARARTDARPLVATMRSLLLRPLAPDALLPGRKRAKSPMDPAGGILRYAKPEFREAIMQRSMAPILQQNTAAERVTAFANHHIPSRCTYFSIIAARHGLAVSFPLLDRAVVDFMLSLPLRMFVWEGYSRQPFRHAMQGILPDSVRLAQAKVGLYDERFLGYAKVKTDLLQTLDALRALPAAQEFVFDLDAIATGLRLLPGIEDAEAIVLGGRAALPGDVPPWVPLMAVECLIAASRAIGQTEG